LFPVSLLLFLLALTRYCCIRTGLVLQLLTLDFGTMCITEHIYHSCGHWGKERFVGEPCVRSRVVCGQHMGCSYKETVGMANTGERCLNCKKYIPISLFDPFEPGFHLNHSRSKSPWSTFPSGQSRHPQSKVRRLSWVGLPGTLRSSQAQGLNKSDLDLIVWKGPRSTRSGQDSLSSKAFSGWYYADGQKCSKWDWFARKSQAVQKNPR
jgi:hypothetical protein